MKLKWPLLATSSFSWHSALFLIWPLSGLVLQPQWLDSAELTLSASQLGIAHPPGQPLYALLFHLCHWLPFGTMPIRLGLLNGLLLWAAVSVMGRFAKRPLATQWFLIGLILWSRAAWTQLLHQELYILQCLLTILMVVNLQHHDQRRFFLGALLLGLSLTLHPLLALSAALPLVIGNIVGRFTHRQSLRNLIWLPFWVVMGLSLYLYLPLRAMQVPAINFGNASHSSDFFWVVSSQLYQSYSHPSFGAMMQNLPAVLALLLEFLQPWGLPFLVFGWWSYLRKNQWQRWTHLGVLLTGLWVVLPNNLFAMDNPDLLGYLLPTFLLATVIGLGESLTQITAWLQSKRRWLRPALALLAVLWLGLQGWLSQRQMRVFHNPSTDSFALALLHEVPLHQAISLGSYHSFMQLLYAQKVEGLRRDVCLSYRGDPRGGHPWSIGQGEAPPCAEQNTLWELSLANRRDAVFLPREPESFLKTLKPAGWFFMKSELTNRSTIEQAVLERHHYFQRWFTEITAPGLKDRLTLNHLLAAQVFALAGLDKAQAWELEQQQRLANLDNY